MDDVYHDIAVRLNLSDSAFNILYTICIFGNGCQQKDICNTTFISKQTIHSSIKKLEQAGILVMQAGKGRDMHIHLTPAGQKLAEEKIIPVIEMENQTFAGMQPEERHQLLILLEKICYPPAKRCRRIIGADRQERIPSCVFNYQSILIIISCCGLFFLLLS